jgi:nitrous oxidase accessory protein
MTQVAMSRIIHVGPGKEFKNIRPALLEAKDYDTVYVYHSQYKEGNIVINKKIVMIGVECLS